MLKTIKKITALGISAIALAAVASFSSGSVHAVTCSTSPCQTSVDVKVTVSSYIQLEISSATPTVANLAPGNTNTSQTSTLTVATNDLSGYTLSTFDADSTNALSRTGGGATIPAGTGIDSGTASAWAIKVTGVPSGTGVGTVTNRASSWTVVPANTGTVAAPSTTTTLATHASPTTARTADAFTITYGVRAAANQVAGTYTDTIYYRVAAGV